MHILLHAPSVNVTNLFNNREVTTIYIHLNTVFGEVTYTYIMRMERVKTLYIINISNFHNISHCT